MATQVFLKIDGIEGEATHEQHRGEIEVLAWSFGMQQPQSSQPGLGGGAGAQRVQVQALSVKKPIDAATPHLWLRCCNGMRHPRARLTVRRPSGEDATPLLELALEEVTVASVATGAAGPEDGFVETIGLSLRRYTCLYHKQNAAGGTSPIGPLGWDIQQNRQIP